ncbi:MAG: competence protein ComEC family protein [Mediterranea sp.]|nr:competence protein ComEC family protein [Mediterranea sp.]
MRLLLPWIAGVLFADRLSGASSLPYALSLLAVAAVGLLLTYWGLCHSRRWLFGACAALFCFAGGWVAMSAQLSRAQYPFPSGETVYRVRLTTRPEAKSRSLLCRARLADPVRRDVLLYLAPDSLAARLTAGSELWVSTCLRPPADIHPSDGFDYARYLLHRGVSATGYVASGRWRLLPVAPVRSLHTLAATYRERVVALYHRLGFEGDALGVLSALTLGQKTELGPSIRESYATAGVSHILALSGLHLGLLYALLLFLLRPLLRVGVGGRWLRAFFIIVALGAFAFFTGLSASVVRSACMFSLLALAGGLGRKALSFNTLVATAWVMLLLRPSWLFDVGFQLSFAAVLAIAGLYGPLLWRCPFTHQVGRYVWGMCSVSVAAEVGTAPLVACYFASFPSYFLLTNLLVIPFITLILYLAIVLLLLTPWPGAQMGMAAVVRFLIDGLNSLVHGVGQWPYASLAIGHLHWVEVMGIYVLLLCAFQYARFRAGKPLVGTFLLLLFLLAFHGRHTIL